jgi:hypothetical protein
MTPTQRIAELLLEAQADLLHPGRARESARRLMSAWALCMELADAEERTLTDPKVRA